MTLQGLRAAFFALLVWLPLFGLPPAQAQEAAFIQIEAQPTLDKALERARAYAAAFPEVAGYDTGSGWHVIVLGPYAPAEAAGKLASLRAENLIPGDSYIVEASRLGARFFPEDGASPEVAADPATEPAPAPAPEPAAEPAPEPEETVKQARASEAALTEDERKMLQTALGWYGHYQGQPDGAFGKGTRASMAAWQEAMGFEPTGVLTTRQRATLVGNYQADQAEFGFEPVTEPEAGIAITLPMALVEFDSYAPPFVKYREKAGSGVTLMLISEPGGEGALKGLYDILQTLEIMPAEGPRGIEGDRFTLEGRSAGVESLAYAETDGTTVKGYLVSWKPADAARMARVLPALRQSFRASGDKAMDPGLVPLDEAARRGMLAGLEVQKPLLSRSGLYLTADGTAATVAEAVQGCGKVTLDHDTPAEVLLTDAASGLALVRPKVALAPRATARLAPASPAPGAEIAVSGYSYEARLPAPVLTFGTFEEDRGLGGEAGLARIAAPVLPGDSGGPVLDATGAVLGVLIPGGAPAGKVLPEGTAFLVRAPVLQALMAQAGLSAAATATAGSPKATPDALSTAATGMTALVSCWK